MRCDLEEQLERLRESFNAKGGRLGLEEVEALSEAKRGLVKCLLGGSLSDAYEWVKLVREALEGAHRRLGIRGYTLPKELSSFIADPVEHLKKKLFNHFNDYLAGKLSYGDLVSKSAATLTTSLRTNMRSCYQLWGLATILSHLAERGYVLAYPEQRFVNFDRSGKQRLGIIPPNLVLANVERGYLSFFHEAPRPLSWGDTSDLQRVWRFYTALRPDLLVYSGRVMDIVDLSSSPPIRRPNVVVEFKELEDWYARVRDLKGYFRRPLTAEEWRHKWWQRLREELIKIADLKGLVDAIEGARAAPSERAPSLRVREPQLLLLYKATYRPDKMILVCRAPLPRDVRALLEGNGVDVFEGVGFDPERLRGVAELLEGFAGGEGGDTVTLEVPRRLALLLSEAARSLNLSYPEVLERALKLLLGEGK